MNIPMTRERFQQWRNSGHHYIPWLELEATVAALEEALATIRTLASECSEEAALREKYWLDYETEKKARADIIAELRNYELNGSDAVKQIRGMYEDLEHAMRLIREQAERIKKLEQPSPGKIRVGWHKEGT